MKVHQTKDASPSAIQGKTIGILGYGIQGRAQAACLRDAGFQIVVGGRPGKSLDEAKQDGFETASFSEAAMRSDIVIFLLPDAVHAEVFKIIKPHLSNKTFVVAHGSSLHFGWIKPPKDCDVVLLAPHGSGNQVRETFLSGVGTVAAFSIHQDASLTARETVLALASALRFTQAGVYECRVKDEAISDLFGEQAILCGGAAELIRQAYQTLIEKGYSKEAAYFGTLYELRGITSLYATEGLDGMLEKVSEAARFGGLENGPKIVDGHVKRNMEKALEEIESGAFMEKFIQENKAGFPKTRELLEREKSTDLSQTGRKIRAAFRIRL